MRFLNNTNFSFLAFGKTAFMISGILFTISFVSLIFQGGPKFGIDFRGGTLIEYRFEDKTDIQKVIDVPIDEVRKVFATAGFENAEIKYYGSHQEIAAQVDVGDITAQIDTVLTGLQVSLESKFPSMNVTERRRESVGPKIGGELVLVALWSVLAAMALILVYIMFRFEFRFGIGAILAIFHDVVITLGIFSVMDIEITVPIVAAILTIIGYSLNDTIVVFDRIRENLKTLKRTADNYSHIVNTSINQTLSRTIVTSGTTLIVVVVLFFAGGEIIKDFAFALICGVIIGTYSSIFIASPVLVEWENRVTAKTAGATKKKKHLSASKKKRISA